MHLMPNKATIEEGIVPGCGGVTLLYASKAFDRLCPPDKGYFRGCR